MAHLVTGSPPTELGGFEVVRRLGAGGMAEVFVAKKRGAEGTYKILVLKRILPTHGTSRRFRTMFVEEAQLATRLNHPNIVQVYEFQDYGDSGLLLCMEYVEGPDLGRLMGAAKTKGMRIPPWIGAAIVSEAAKGLHYAHERKEGDVALEIVHRDVSPQNILLSYEGGVKIADFGIAKASLFGDDSGVLKGKVGYMSPEQARGEKVDRRSDIYSLGVVLHELLASRPLHGTLKGDELLDAVRGGMIEPPSTFVREVPSELDAIVMKALARDPDMRFQSGRDMSAAITRAMFQRQELVDAAAIEATIAQVVGREESTGLSGLPPSIIDPAGSLALPADPNAAGMSQAPAPSGDTDVGQKTGEGRPRKHERALREVRHVAILTLRLHGFLELDVTLGQAATARLADRIRATLEDIAYKHGAHWTWDANHTARASVGLLANPGRAAADAAWLAIDTHEALAGASEDLATPIRATVGIVRGIATGTRDPLGHLVEHTIQQPAEALAQLIREHAPVGRTWVAGGLYRLVRREFRWGDAPTIEATVGGVDGGPVSMRMYALERPLTRDERMTELAVAPSDLVGREAEKADLHAAYHLAAASGGQVVCRAIVGEMGIGKSALVATFLNELPPDRRILRIECSPARSELPFGVVAELVRESTASTPEQTLDQVAANVMNTIAPLGDTEQARAMATSLAELVTGRRERETDDEDHPFRRQLMLGVRRLIGALAARQPLVIIIEGMQWGDHPGLELLSKLLRRHERLPVLALLVSRPEHRVLPYLEGYVRIELKGLSPEEQVRLLQLRLGVQDGVAEVSADLMPKVAGNPFFLLEMVDALLERGALEIQPSTSGKQTLSRVDRPSDRAQPLPSTLEQLIGDRLAELPPEEHLLVDWLAVAGGPLQSSDLLLLARLESDEPLARLLARGVCDKKGEDIDLRYPLARDVAYLAIHAGERIRMHRRLGEHLSRTPLAKGASAALVARHLARGHAHEPAAMMFLEAAVAARNSFQSKLAIKHYQRALALLPQGDARRLIAHEALENIYRTLGRRRERRKYLVAMRTLARKLGQPKWVALALTRTARLDLDEGLLARGLPVAQKAEAVAQKAKVPAVEVEALSILSGLLRELGDTQGALSTCDRALIVAAKPDVPPRARAEVLQARGILLRRLGRVREAVDSFAEAIAVLRRAGARRQEARVKNSLAFAMFLLERFEDAIGLALASIRIDLAIGGRFQVAKTLTTIGRCYARLGDLPRSLAYLKRAREAHEHYRDQDSRAETLLASAEVLVEAGDLDAAHVFAGDASALNAVTGNAYDLVYEKIVRAQIARASGDMRAAATLAREARTGAEGQALLSFNLFATALEAISRVEAGEAYAGSLLASNALGAVDEVQGTEYGLAVRALCAQALSKAGSPQATIARERAAEHVKTVAAAIGDPRLRELFTARPIVADLLREPGTPPSAGSTASP